MRSLASDSRGTEEQWAECLSRIGVVLLSLAAVLLALAALALIAWFLCGVAGAAARAAVAAATKAAKDLQRGLKLVQEALKRGDNERALAILATLYPIYAALKDLIGKLDGVCGLAGSVLDSMKRAWRSFVSDWELMVAACRAGR